MTSVGILGATGYAGAELARILYRHPHVRLASVAGAEGIGERLGDFYPHLHPLDLTIKHELDDVDVVLAALPHKVAASLLLPWIDRGKLVLDLSADFRLKDVATYEQWYGVSHPRPEILEKAVYGLPELHRKDIAGADFSRWAKPEEIATVLLVLISDGASVVSGAAIPVYGKS